MMLLFVSVLGASTPTVLPQQPQTAPAAVSPAPQKEKKICRADSAATGSVMVKRLCLTRVEWDRRDGAATSAGASN